MTIVDAADSGFEAWWCKLADDPKWTPAPGLPDLKDVARTAWRASSIDSERALATVHACACAVCPNCAAGVYPLIVPKGDDSYRHDMRSFAPTSNAPVACRASAIHRLFGMKAEAASG